MEEIRIDGEVVGEEADVTGAGQEIEIDVETEEMEVDQSGWTNMAPQHVLTTELLWRTCLAG